MVEGDKGVDRWQIWEGPDPEELNVIWRRPLRKIGRRTG